MSVQQSVSASETFDEKITAAQEKAAALEGWLAAQNLKNGVKKSANTANKAASAFVTFVFLAIFCVIVMMVLTAVASGLGMKNGDPVAITLIVFVSISITVFLAVRSKKKPTAPGPEYVDTSVVEAELEMLKNQIEGWKIEKRNFLLAHNVNIVETDHVLKDTLQGQIGGDEKECPRCAEFVKGKAKVCRFCGYEFEVMSS